MPLLESILSLVAPHDCLGCGREGALLCTACGHEAVPRLPARCYGCLSVKKGSKTCAKCRRTSSLQYVYVRTQYEGAAKQLVHMLKFERAYAASRTVASLMSEVFPKEFDGLIVPVPTATVRRRQRGYDQAELIARALAKKHKVKLLNALSRRGSSRQVGTKRAERLVQLKNSFYVPYQHQISGKTILLVDDVLTTSATLETAAKALRQAGAKHVSAIVFAQA